MIGGKDNSVLTVVITSLCENRAAPYALSYSYIRQKAGFPTMTNERPESPSGQLVISYLTLRKIVGVLGTSLPLVLIVGAWVIFGTGGQSSISDYYHTGMGDVFVGTLCVIGFFLLSYRGYEPIDNIAGNLACVFCVGVALFPTTPEVITSGTDKVVGLVHLIFAALFFTTLIFFSLFLFTRTGPGQPTRRKLQRNRVYRACGFVMGGCIVGILVFYLLPDRAATALEGFSPVFWLEGAAVIAFGVSWLVKGEAILSDRPTTPASSGPRTEHASGS